VIAFPTQDELVSSLIDQLGRRNRAAVAELLHAEAVLTVDSGGHAARLRSSRGREGCAAELLRLAADLEVEFEAAQLNGSSAVTARAGGSVVTALVVEAVCGRITVLRAVANPEKLGRV
jgi:hypothetical protein